MFTIRADWDPLNNRPTDQPGCKRVITKLVNYGTEIAAKPEYKAVVGTDGISHIAKMLKECIETTIIVYDCSKPNFEEWLNFVGGFEKEFRDIVKRILDSLKADEKKYTSVDDLLLSEKLEKPLFNALER